MRWLYRHQDRVVSRAELLEQVFGQRGDLQTRAVDMAIAVLRKKLETDPATANGDRLGQGRGVRMATARADHDQRAPRAFYAAGLLAALLAALLGAWFCLGLARRAACGNTRCSQAPRVAAEQRADELARELRAELEALIAREVRRPYFHYQNLMHDPKASAGTRRLAVAARARPRGRARARLLPARRQRPGDHADDQRRRAGAVGTRAPRRQPCVSRSGRARSVSVSSRRPLRATGQLVAEARPAAASAAPRPRPQPEAAPSLARRNRRK